MESRQNSRMTRTLQELAGICGAELQGDPGCEITGVAALDQAQPGDIGFVNDRKYRSFLDTTRAGAVILTPDLAAAYPGNKLVIDDPYLAYARVVEALFPPAPAQAFVHPSAVIGEGAVIGEAVYLDAHSVVGDGCRLADRVRLGPGSVLGPDCEIGESSVIGSNVSIGGRTRIGRHCLIHAGVVIGADGFGFAVQKDGRWHKITQVGRVVIGDRVEIGANSCVDRAAIGTTRLDDGVKLDNLIQIGHNTHLGEDTIVAAHTAIAGSTRIGRRCRIGGAVAIAGHLEIADDVAITGNSMVTHSLRQPGVYSSGIAVDDNRNWRRNSARFRKLDELFRRVIRIEKRIGP